MFDISDDYWAHTKKDAKPETLNEHILLTKEYLYRLKTAKNLHENISNLSKIILENRQIKLTSIFDNLIIYHDIGKTNPNFQSIKMKNSNFSTIHGEDSNHSDRSYFKFKENYEKDSWDKNLEETYIFYSLLLNVLFHHGKFQNREWKEHLRYNPPAASEPSQMDLFLYKKIQNDKIKFPNECLYMLYIFIKLHYSLLIASDFYATSDYMNSKSITEFGTFDDVTKDKIVAKFECFYSSLKPTKKIDSLRQEIFNTTENNLLKSENSDKNIFYLEAPTGSGKTITSINLALKLLKNDSKLNKIFYVFPFNTIAEQTKNCIKNIFGDTLNFTLINSTTPPDLVGDDENIDYNKTHIDRMFFNSPLVLTSHVRLFEIMFGTSKESNYPFYQLANSVIILDEIQSYDCKLYEFMAEMFDKFASALNIKFIIMSATLPKISRLLDKEDGWVDLIDSETAKEIFSNEIFKDRVKIDFSMLDNTKKFQADKNLLFDDIKSKILSANKDKILIEFISKKVSRECLNYFQDLTDLKEYQIYELTGDDNKLYRMKIIDEIKNSNKKIILISTQVIEAGVDIDMDMGFKDISFIESEEQFLGRINRNSKKSDAIAYFFNFTPANKIYSGDRLKFNLLDKSLQKMLLNKDFSKYYKDLLKEAKSSNDRSKNGIQSIRDEFTQNIKDQQFENIEKAMTLINDNSDGKIFIPLKIDISEFKDKLEDEFGNLDAYIVDGKLDGQEIWDALKDLQNIESYSQQKVEAISLYALANLFSFNIYKKEKDNLRNYTEKYGFYFLNEYSEFIDKNGRFDRQKFHDKYNNKDLII